MTLFLFFSFGIIELQEKEREREKNINHLPLMPLCYYIFNVTGVGKFSQGY
jgi:hypothetical protein